MRPPYLISGILNAFLFVLFAGMEFGFCQTGPGGVGNAAGSAGQPRNRVWLSSSQQVFQGAGVTPCTNGTTVRQWNDLSGNNHHVTQGTAGNRPTFYTGILNSLPVVRFDGTSDELLFGAALNNTNALPFSLFTVTHNTTNPRGLFDSYPSGTNVFRFYNDGSGGGPGASNSVEFWNNNPATGGVNLNSSGSVLSVVGSLDGSSNRELATYLQGTQIGTTLTGNNTAVRFSGSRIGSINSGSEGRYGGDIAEMILFTTAINRAQQIIVENYLAALYNINLSSNDYYTNTTYNQNLIGIGTTDGTVKHSLSSGGGIELEENNSSLDASNEFIFAGHNNTSHSASNNSNLLDAAVVAAGITTRWAREYRIEKTGNADLKLTFDYTSAGLTRSSNTPEDFYLLFRSTTGATDFTLVSLAATPDVSVANRVSFQIANGDLANGYYTLGLKSQPAAGTLYSYTTNCSGGCNWHTTNSWTTDPTGLSLVNPRVPRSIDNVAVLTGSRVNVTQSGVQVVTATVNSGGTLDLGTTTGNTFTTLSGSGTLALSATSGTATFPTITTNNLITTSGSTVDYNGAGSFSLPSSPSTYRNLTISGGGAKTFGAALTINQTFTISTGTSFTTSGNLNLNGNFVINGQLTQSAGTTTFGSNVAQSISGAPSTCLFYHLTINNSGVGAQGTITSTIDFTVAGNFTSSSNNTTSFNATSGSVIMSSNSAQSLGGTGSGAVIFYNLFTSGSGIKTISRNFSVTNSLVITAGSTLQYPATGTGRTVTTRNIQGYGSFNMATPGSATTHTLNVSGSINLATSSVLNLVNGTNVANCTFNGTSQSISGDIPSVVDFNQLTISAGSTTQLSNFNIVIRNNLTISGSLDLGIQTANRATAGGTLLINGTGTLRIGGTQTFPSNYNTITLNSGSTVDYYGTTQNIRALSYHHLIVSGGSAKTLTGATGVYGTLTMSTALIQMGNNNFTLAQGSSIAGDAPSVNNMVVATGTGFFIRFFNTTGSYHFPVGTSSVYSPATLNITSATFVACSNVGIRPVASQAPNQLDATYSLNRYWNLSSTNMSNISGTLTLPYPISEENSTVEPIYVPAYYNTTSPGWTLGNVSQVASQVIDYSISAASHLNGNYTAGPSVAFIPGNFYSLNTGPYEAPGNWSMVSYGGAPSLLPPTTGSNVWIGNNVTISLTSGSKNIATLTLDGAPTPGTFNISTYTGITIGTFNGSGTLRITTIGANAVYPTVTTNNFNSTAGSTTEYYGAGTYTLPAAPLSYQNLSISGSGTKTLGGNTNVLQTLQVQAGGVLNAGASNLTVTGASTIAGTLNDADNGGTNTFTGNLFVSGTLSTSNLSPFVFSGGMTNNGTFSKTGTGSVTFSTNNQVINGTNPITLAGTVTVNSGVTVDNQNDALTLTSLSLGQNAKFTNSYSSFPTSYTGTTNGYGIINTYNSVSTSNNAGNSISTTTGDNLILTRAGAGSVYALKSTNFSSPASVHVVQFELSATSTGATNTAATFLLGSGFADNNTIHTAAARLRLNLGAAACEYSITYPDGTPATSAVQNSVQTITWVVNQSGATVSYINPGNPTGAALTLASNRADVWVGSTRFLAGQTLQTAAQTISQLKIVMSQGNGTFTINNLRINPLGTVNTPAGTAFCVTPYDGDSATISFSSAGGMNSQTHFNNGNVFTVQISNASGSFATPTTIGTLTSTSLTGTIPCFLPANTANGTGYKLRVVSSNPVGLAAEFACSVSLFKISPAGSQSIDVTGSGTLLTASGLNITSYQWAYYTVLGGPEYDLSGQTSSTYTPSGPDFPGAGTYSLICRMTSSSGCSNVNSNEVILYINCPAGTNLVTNGDFSAGNTGFTTSYNYVVDDPSIRTEMFPEQTYAVVDNPYDVHSHFCNMNSAALRSPVSGGNMLVGNAATSGSLTLWQQNIPVTPNTDYVLSFWAVSLAGPTSSLLFGIYTGCYRTGADISVPFETTNCVWNKYSVQFNSGNNTTIPLAIRNISALAAGNDIAIDDIVIFACASVSSPPFSVANTPQWRGISTDWFNQDNWGSSCGIPTCNEDAVIPPMGRGKVYPTINAAGAAARSVTIQTGAKLTINSGYNLNVCGSFSKSGTFVGNGNSTVTLTGSQNPAIISGSFTGSHSLPGLIINKSNPTDTVRLACNVDIINGFTNTQGQFKAESYTMKIGGNYSNSGFFYPGTSTVEFNGSGNQSITQSGTGSFYNLRLNNSSASNTLTFNSAATVISNQLNLTKGQAVTSGDNYISVTNPNTNSVINHSGIGYVRGRLRRSISGTGSYDYPVGDASRYQLLNMDVTSPLIGTSYVTGYFTGTTAAGTLPILWETFYYYEYVCQNGFWTLNPDVQPSSGLYNIQVAPVGLVCQGVYQTLAKRNNSSSAWTFGGSTAVSSTQRNGFSSFSEFAQIDAEQPLPLDLLTFDGKWVSQNVILNWKTANERCHSHFVVERSVDGNQFESIGKVEKPQSAETSNLYQFRDPNPAQRNYYRLRQVDEDGSVSFSQVVALTRTQSPDLPWLEPNPSLSTQSVHIRMISSTDQEIRLKATDLRGREIFHTSLKLQQGQNRLELTETRGLAKGMYLLHLEGIEESGDAHHPIRLLIE